MFVYGDPNLIVFSPLSSSVGCSVLEVDRQARLLLPAPNPTGVTKRRRAMGFFSANDGRIPDDLINHRESGACVAAGVQQAHH